MPLCYILHSLNLVVEFSKHSGVLKDNFSVTKLKRTHTSKLGRKGELAPKMKAAGRLSASWFADVHVESKKSKLNLNLRSQLRSLVDPLFLTYQIRDTARLPGLKLSGDAAEYSVVRERFEQTYHLFAR